MDVASFAVGTGRSTGIGRISLSQKVGEDLVVVPALKPFHVQVARRAGKGEIVCQSLVELEISSIMAI